MENGRTHGEPVKTSVMCLRAVRTRQAAGDVTPRMRFTRWLNKATDTYSGYVILVAFPRQQWLHECVSV
jgi:hypothetical protein